MQRCTERVTSAWGGLLINVTRVVQSCTVAVRMQYVRVLPDSHKIF